MSKFTSSTKKILSQIKIGDILILLIFLTLALLFIFRPKKSKDFISIKANGKDFIYPLNKDATYDIEGLLGTSKIEVKDSKVRFLYSPCPNQTCVALGWGTTLICLPNDVIVSVESKDNQNNLDGITF